MDQSLDPLVFDLVEWVSKAPRPYTEMLDVWRTSCPRLTVWEEAAERGYLTRTFEPGQGTLVHITEKGRSFLTAHRTHGLGPRPARQASWAR
jgi:hypothetical protein